jgi:protein involved in polysaccharide export with SLBB domain
MFKKTISLLIAALMLTSPVLAGSDRLTTFTIDQGQYMPPQGKPAESSQANAAASFDPVTYTLGPADVIEIEVMRHPEFSGRYPINQEGKIQYKFVGDISLKGFTKQQVEEKVKEALAQFVVNPEVSVSIVEYGSKSYYVIGEIVAPGQFIMKSEEISVRDAIHLAGMPTQNAQMRQCQIITPGEDGSVKIRRVNLYKLMYYGDLRHNPTIKPGEILYVPATVMAKSIRILSPLASLLGIMSSMPESAATAKGAVEKLKGKTNLNY